jgi:hypothetical protein
MEETKERLRLRDAREQNDPWKSDEVRLGSGVSQTHGRKRYQRRFAS